MDHAKCVLNHIIRIRWEFNFRLIILGELPHIRSKTYDPFFTVNMDHGDAAAGKCCRCQDVPEGSILKFKDRRGHVLSFTIFVVVDIKMRADDTFDGPHKPEHQIYIMHTLVHDGTPTVEFPSAVPTHVVAIWTFPFHTEFTEQWSPQSTCFKDLLDTAIVSPVAFTKIHKQLDIIVFACFNESVAIFDTDIHRFCCDNMFAAACRFFSEFSV